MDYVRVRGTEQPGVLCSTHGIGEGTAPMDATGTQSEFFETVYELTVNKGTDCDLVFL
jgi:hypothetical protein